MFICGELHHQLPQTDRQDCCYLDKRLRSAFSIFSSDASKSFSCAHHCFRQSPSPMKLAINCFPSFKNASARLLLPFLQGQSGRGVNEWQSVLITRRGYLGLVRLISRNAFYFLMLPNCRLHKAGPFIIARQSSASNESSTESPELCGRIHQAAVQFVTVWITPDHPHLFVWPPAGVT